MDALQYQNNIRLEEVKKIIAKNSCINPYLMFPLRLETHFREKKVDINCTDEEKELALLYENIWILICYILENKERRNENSESRLIFELNRVLQQIKSIDIIDTQTKSGIVELVQWLHICFSSRAAEKKNKEKALDFIEKIKKASIEIRAIKRDKDDAFGSILKKIVSIKKIAETLLERDKTPYSSVDFFSKPENRAKYNFKFEGYLIKKAEKLDNEIFAVYQEMQNYRHNIGGNPLGMLTGECRDLLSYLKSKSLELNIKKIYKEHPAQLNHALKVYHTKCEKQMNRAISNCEKLLLLLSNKSSEDCFLINSAVFISQQVAINIIFFAFQDYFNYANKNQQNVYNQDITNAIQILLFKMHESVNFSHKQTVDATTNREERLIKELINKNLELIHKNSSYSRRMPNYIEAEQEAEQEIDTTDFQIDESKKGLAESIYNYLMPNLINSNSGSLFELSRFEDRLMTFQVSSPQKSYYKLQKQLCVRIFPDEIFLHQHKKELKKEQIDDGHRFWIKSYISPNAAQEKIYWESLCKKYGSLTASWIVRCTRFSTVTDPNQSSTTKILTIKDLLQEVNDLEKITLKIINKPGTQALRAPRGRVPSAELGRNRDTEKPSAESVLQNITLATKKINEILEKIPYLEDDIDNGIYEILRKKITEIKKQFSGIKNLHTSAIPGRPGRPGIHGRAGIPGNKQEVSNPLVKIDLFLKKLDVLELKINQLKTKENKSTIRIEDVKQILTDKLVKLLYEDILKLKRAIHTHHNEIKQAKVNELSEQAYIELILKEENIALISKNTTQVKNKILFYQHIQDKIYEKIKKEIETIDADLASLIAKIDNQRLIALTEANNEEEKRKRTLTELEHKQKELKDLLKILDEQKTNFKDLIEYYVKEAVEAKAFVDEHCNPEKAELQQKLPPSSRILPDRFVFSGSINEDGRSKQIVYAGRKIPNDLALGLDINEEEDIKAYDLDKETGEISFNGSLKWLFDYEEAERVGMAITIPLTDKQYDATFKSISVIGVKSCSNHERKEALEEQFIGHIYGGKGLDFIQVGTPTNSTDTNPLVINPQSQEIIDKRFEIEVENRIRPKINNETNDAKLLSEALGFDVNKVFGSVNSYDNKERIHAQVINKLFDEVFKVNILRNIDEKHKLFHQFINNINPFLQNYCFSRGALPMLRIGMLPYGILPTTAFSSFKLDPSLTIENIKYEDDSALAFAVQLHAMLKDLSHLWNRFIKTDLIHIDNLNETKKSDEESPQIRFLRMISNKPVSSNFKLNVLFQSELFDANDRVNDANERKRISRFMSHLLGIDSKKSGGIYEQSRLQNFESFKSIDYSRIDNTYEEKIQKKLLNIIGKKKYKTELNAVLLELFEDQKKASLIGELLDLFTYRIDAWWSALVYYQLCRLNNSKFIREIDFNRAKAQDKPNIQIAAYGWVENLSRNKNKKTLNSTEKKLLSKEMKMKIAAHNDVVLDTKNGGILLAPTLTHAISGAVMRSSYERSRQENSHDNRLCINLSSGRVRRAMEIIDGINSGLTLGAILGISLERSLHEAYKHKDLEMDRFIHPLRKCFPLRVEALKTKVDISGEGAATKSAYNLQVINGDMLIGRVLEKIDWYKATDTDTIYAKIRQKARSLFDDLNIGLNDQQFECLAALIEELIDSYDAFNDVLLSEGVYQMVQGNRVALNAMMRKIETGGAPANIEVVKFTSRSAMINQRIAVNFPTKSVKEQPKYWNSSSVLHQIDPSLNAWMAEILGDPRNIVFAIDFVDENKKTIKQEKHSLAEFNLSALEYVFLANNEALFADLIKTKYVFELSKETKAMKISLNMKAEGIRLENKEVSLYENRLLVESLREVVRSSNSLNATDFTTVASQQEEFEREGEAQSYDSTELKKRVTEFHRKIKEFLSQNEKMIAEIKELFSLVEKGKMNDENAITKELIKDKLIKESSLFINQCILLGNQSLSQSKNSELLIQSELYKKAPKTNEKKIFDKFNETKTLIIKEQFKTLKYAEEAYKQLSEKLSTADKIMQKLENQKTEGDKIISCQEIAKTLTTNSFKLIPHFSFEALDPQEKEGLALQLHDSFKFENTTALDCEDWLTELAKVRKAAIPLLNIRMHAIARDQDSSALFPLQVPFSANDKKEWIGRTLSSDDDVQDKHSIMLWNKKAIRMDGNNAGFVIDKWFEIIPRIRQKAGAAFNYDSPDSEAPQAILLAIADQISNTEGKLKYWNLNKLITVLNDTRTMAKYRAVDPEILYNDPFVAKFIPSLVLEKGVVKNSSEIHDFVNKLTKEK